MYMGLFVHVQETVGTQTGCINISLETKLMNVVASLLYLSI